ncbi:hypothetical protein ABTY64_31240, partial [Streptomyces albidoflavus]
MGGRPAGQCPAGGRVRRRGRGRPAGRRGAVAVPGGPAVPPSYDTVLDRQVAIKTLHTELGREAAFRERFRRE